MSFAATLPDGRLHLQHGPIDLIVDAEGAGRAAALRAASARFDGLLEELVAELPRLRCPLDGGDFASPTARRMARAVAPFGAVFVTPMAAVAGAVADEVLAAMVAATVTKAYVNNGGDIAFYLADGVFGAASPAGPIEVTAKDRARGLATSGWRGRSHSLGIADAVTVLAADAARADAAATLIANAVDLPGHPAIARVPARALSPDSDLGARGVTTDVGALSDTDRQTALARGAARAETFRKRGLIEAATLTLGPLTRIIEPEKTLTDA